MSCHALQDTLCSVDIECQEEDISSIIDSYGHEILWHILVEELLCYFSDTEVTVLAIDDVRVVPHHSIQEGQCSVDRIDRHREGGGQGNSEDIQSCLQDCMDE